MPTPQCTINHYNPEIFPETRGVSSHDIGRRWKDGVDTYEIPFKAYDDDGELYFSGVFRAKADKQWRDNHLDDWLDHYLETWQQQYGVTSLKISEDYGLKWAAFP